MHELENEIMTTNAELEGSGSRVTGGKPLDAEAYNKLVATSSVHVKEPVEPAAYDIRF